MNEEGRCTECRATNYGHYQYCSQYGGGKKGHKHAALMAEYAEVAQTSETPWMEFEIFVTSIETWTAVVCSCTFDPRYAYRRKPKAPKKIKFEAWVDSVGELHRAMPGIPRPGWTRLPALDLECEVGG